MPKKRKNYQREDAQLMREFLEQGRVLAEWDLIIKKFKKTGNEYKMKTQRGDKLLKVGFQEDRILFMHLALEHLARNGCYRGIPRLIPTKYGDYYVKSDLGIYYLTDWIDGKKGKAKEMTQVIEFVRFLAEIHLAGKHFQPVPAWTKRERFDDISRHIRENIRIVNESLDRLPGVLKDAWRTYESMAEKAQYLLNFSGYRLLQEEAEKNLTLCHRRYAPGHGVRTKDSINMLHWEHCAYGVQIGDLIYFLQKVLPVYDWNYHAGEQVIKAYHRIRPLSREELMTMGAALMFPGNFIKLVQKYLRGKLTSDKISEKLAKVNAREAKRKAFLEEFFRANDLKGFFGRTKGHSLSNAWYLVDADDFKFYIERKGEGISGLMLRSFLVTPQGKLKEEGFKDIKKISKSYSGPIFPAIFTSQNSQERENTFQVLGDHYLKERLLNEIEQVIKEHNFPGINISFEVRSEEEMLLFNKFIKSLSRIVHEYKKILLVNVAAAKGENLFYDYAYLAKYCDYLLVEIMEEDASCPARPVSRDYIQAAIIYAAAYLPREKIVAVLPVSGETADSILEKAFLARGFGVAGCAFWRLGLEDPEIWSRKPDSGVLGKKVYHEDDEDD
jgi:CotS family spore coat protein